MSTWLVLIACGLGHVGLWIWILNVLHGLGLSEQRLALVNPGLALSFLALSVGLISATWQTPWSEWPMAVQIYGGLCLALLGLALPASTLSRILRPMPRDVTRETEHDHVDLAARYGRQTLVGTGRFRSLVTWPGNEVLTLERYEYRVERLALHPALEGLTILHLSDLHIIAALDRRFFEAMLAEATAGPRPDLVLFTGDLIDAIDQVDWIAPLLERIPARLGKYAILGNHDHKYDVQPIVEGVEAGGFEILEGRWVRLEVLPEHAKPDLAPAYLTLGGTSEPWGPALDQAMPEADYHILLSHTPDRFYRAAKWGVDLILAGHNHGGQIRLPGLGPILMPSVYSRRFDHGFFRQGGTTMYVSRGMGGKHPIRYYCPPEVARIQLRARGAVEPIPLATAYVNSLAGLSSTAALTRDVPPRERSGHRTDPIPS